MKKLEVLILVNFIFCPIFGQVLKLEKVGEKYSRKSPFEFHLTSSADSTIWFSAELEMLDNNKKWVTAQDDIFNYTVQKITHSYTIKGHAKKKVVFFPDRYPPFPNLPSLSHFYRLKIQFGYDYQRSEGEIYSDSFRFYK
jgi:hypothetical protein